MKELFNHQEKIVKENPKYTGLWWSPGCGKSLAAIRLAANNAQRILVVTPKSIRENFEREIKDGDINNREWLVITKEHFKKIWKTLIGYDGLILDESHNYFNYRSQLHKSAYDYLLKNKPKCLYCLTGTVYLSNYWNVYSMSKIFGKEMNWYKFKQMFFYEIKMASRMVPMPRKGMDEQLIKIIKDCGSVVKLEDCADVPDQVFEIEYFELTKAQKQAVEAIEDWQPLVYATRCHQICGNKDSEKLARVIELAQEHKKLVIVSRYTDEIEMLRAELSKKKTVYVLNGATKDRQTLIDNAESSNECVFIVNCSMGFGFNLPSFPIMIFYSMSWSVVDYLQMLGRVQRLNALKKNVYMFLLVKKSIDQEVYDNVVIKKCDFNHLIYGQKL